MFVLTVKSFVNHFTPKKKDPPPPQPIWWLGGTSFCGLCLKKKIMSHQTPENVLIAFYNEANRAFILQQPYTLYWLLDLYSRNIH